MIVYLGLVDGRHVAVNMADLRVYYLKTLESKLDQSFLKKPLKSFELTEYVVDNLRKAIINHISLFQSRIVKFVNQSGYLTVKVHALHYLRLSDSDINGLVAARSKAPLETIADINKHIRSRIEVQIAAIVAHELKSNKSQFIDYLTKADDNTD